MPSTTNDADRFLPNNDKSIPVLNDIHRMAITDTEIQKQLRDFIVEQRETNQEIKRVLALILQRVSHTELSHSPEI